MNGDLISRKALLSKMFPYGMPDNGNYGINARAVRDAVVGAKAVEAEPVVHAHWVVSNSEIVCCGYCCEFTCSHCGSNVELPVAVKNCEYDRCPHCGAHMDEEVVDG